MLSVTVNLLYCDVNRKNQTRWDRSYEKNLYHKIISLMGKKDDVDRFDDCRHLKFKKKEKPMIRCKLIQRTNHLQ